MIERVWWNTSLMAAQISSLVTNNLVHGGLGNLEAELAHLLHRDAVGEDADVVESHAPSGLEGPIERVRLEGLDAYDLHGRRKVLEVAPDPGDQPAPADRNEDRVEVAAVAEDLDGDRALSRDHERVVERVDEGEAAL